MTTETKEAVQARLKELKAFVAKPNKTEGETYDFPSIKDEPQANFVTTKFMTSLMVFQMPPYVGRYQKIVTGEPQSVHDSKLVIEGPAMNDEQPITLKIYAHTEENIEISKGMAALLAVVSGFADYESYYELALKEILDYNFLGKVQQIRFDSTEIDIEKRNFLHKHCSGEFVRNSVMVMPAFHTIMLASADPYAQCGPSSVNSYVLNFDWTAVYLRCYVSQAPNGVIQPTAHQVQHAMYGALYQSPQFQPYPAYGRPPKAERQPFTPKQFG